MATVWVVCRDGRKSKDLSSAERFGQLRYIGERYVYPDELGSHGSLPAEVTNRLRNAVVEFSTSDDFVLMFGDDVQLVALCAMLGAYNRSFQALRWDRVEKCYVPVLIPSRRPT